MEINTYAERPQPIRVRYAEVLKHYSCIPSDSLKYKAALFLIDNIGFHTSVQSKSQSVYYSRLADIEKKYKFPECKKQIYALVDSVLSLENVPFMAIPDEKVVSCKYLIDNIDDAFDKWQNGNFAKHLSFEDFCEYLLPYKLTNEQVECWRAELYNQYKRGIESIIPIDDKKYSAYWGLPNLMI